MNMEFSEKASWRIFSSFNVKWYFHVMREMLIKYKVLSIFLICLLAPSVGFLLKVAMGPAEIYLYSGRSNIMEFSIFLLSAQLFSIIFGLIHRAVLTNRQWDRYMSSLPVPIGQKIISDFITLTLANSLFLTTIFYEYVIHLMKFNSNFLEVSLRVFFLVLMMYSIQLAVIYKKNSNLIFSMMLGLMTVPLIFFAPMPVEVLLISIASYLLYYELFSIYTKQWKKNRAVSLSHFVKLSDHSPWHVLIQLNIKIILNDFRAFFARILPLIILSGVFFVLLLSGGFALNASKIIFTLVLLLNMFFLSNIFKPVYSQWEEYRSYISSIPLSKFKLLTSIFMPGLFFGALANLFLMCIFNIAFVMGNALSELGTQVLISWLYLFCCFNLQIKFKRYGVLASFVGLVPFYYLTKLLT